LLWWDFSRSWSGHLAFFALVSRSEES
jgi:hypothetical protein